MNRNKATLLGIVVVLGIILISFLILSHKESDKEVKRQKEEKSISDLKYETGATADEELYTIEKDVDGREVLAVKQELLYKVALAGVLKQEKPTYEEIDTILQQNPIHEGIWISTESREKIFSLIQTYLKDSYQIDENGYLQLIEQTENSTQYDKDLQKCLNNHKTYILSMTGNCYTIDNMTGEIVFYPFERMDAYQLCEPFVYDNKKIIILSTNQQKRLEEEELVECITEQMNLE